MSNKGKSSRIRGFYKMSRGERLDQLRAFAEIPSDQVRVLGQDGALPFENADLFVENAIGNFPMPLGVATSFKINGQDYIIPMAVEESSVIAATSNAARIIYESGGFEAVAKSELMIGQIQLLDIHPGDFDLVQTQILNRREDLLRMANETHPRLLMRGGGARDIEVRLFPEAEIPFIVVQVLLDTRDAMGANLVNTVCERLAPEIEEITGARVALRILSNLADRKLFVARCRIPFEKLSICEPHFSLHGRDLAQRIFEAFVFADTDPYRAATHNKGIMNGVDPIAIATGNDWRAIEAGAHAYAAQSGRYRSLTKWRLQDNCLVGELEIPLQLGTVGGVTRLHPVSKLALQILGNPSAKQLGCVIASAGLASNFAALRALTTVGIQRGHMRLHAKNLALAAGARGEEIEILANRLVVKGVFTASAAELQLQAVRNAQPVGSRAAQNSEAVKSYP